MLLFANAFHSVPHWNVCSLCKIYWYPQNLWRRFCPPSPKEDFIYFIIQHRGGLHNIGICAVISFLFSFFILSLFIIFFVKGDAVTCSAGLVNCGFHFFILPHSEEYSQAISSVYHELFCLMVYIQPYTSTVGHCPYIPFYPAIA